MTEQEKIDKAAHSHASRYAGADSYALYVLAFKAGAQWFLALLKAKEINGTLRTYDADTQPKKESK